MPPWRKLLSHFKANEAVDEAVGREFEFSGMDPDDLVVVETLGLAAGPLMLKENARDTNSLPKTLGVSLKKLGGISMDYESFASTIGPIDHVCWLSSDCRRLEVLVKEKKQMFRVPTRVR